MVWFGDTGDKTEHYLRDRGWRWAQTLNPDKYTDYNNPGVVETVENDLILLIWNKLPPFFGVEPQTAQKALERIQLSPPSVNRISSISASR